MNLSTSFPINENSQIGDARRQVAHMAEQCDFNESQRSNLSIIINELAGNLLKHTPDGGQLIVRIIDDHTRADRRRGIEVLCMDKAGGMESPDQCMVDGYSTAGSPGTGLGAIKRLSTVFGLYSIVGQGTIVLSQIWNSPEPHFAKRGIQVGAISIPIRGEVVSGDAWQVFDLGDVISVVIADGLGHGILAAAASEEALRIAAEAPDAPPQELLKVIHQALNKSRGAAVGIAHIDLQKKSLVYCGVGNTVGVIQNYNVQKRLFSHNGTAGIQTRRLQEFTYEWNPHSFLIMHSDGISTHWAIEKYVGLNRCHPSIIACVLYRDFSRGNDDAAVVVMKCLDADEAQS